MALQMSLMGAMPVTKDNLIHILNAKEPIDIIDILLELGYERSSKEYHEAWDKATAILKPMCRHAEAFYSVYTIREVFPDGVERGVYYHKFSRHKLPEAGGPVNGYEALDPDDDDDADEEDQDIYKQILNDTKKEARKA